MNPTCKAIRIWASALLAGVLASCEQDDPKIRTEVAELRARVAELEKQGAGTKSAAAPDPSGSSSDNLSRDTLQRNLDRQMPALRAALTKAFPEYRVDPVSAATISTPKDSDYLPYTTELSFGLSKGQTVASFSIRIGADRSGNWQMPEFEDLAASVGNLASAGMPQGNSAGASGRGAMMNNNVRQIQWPDGAGAPSSPYGQSQPAPMPQEPMPQRQPSGNAPFPVQETRTVEFD